MKKEKIIMVKDVNIRTMTKGQEMISWTAKRELSKINYRIHTDAIKRHLIPEETH